MKRSHARICICLLLANKPTQPGVIPLPISLVFNDLAIILQKLHDSGWHDVCPATFGKTEINHGKRYTNT
jgi:hypothetical protein